ncbi:Glutamate receptor 3.2 isoform C [Glycine soja]|uniref:Glutamate receptor 3.2 isoform C n=1 Tax=Glycine soja TaxID=3848 RepID=A0A445HIK3_GLYSO|nr:Glutamate receptor 3.2 isoform C [Glycine soja]
MSDLGNLSLSAALKLSHYSSDDALDAPVKTLTNGFDSEPAFETWVLKRTHGSLDRVNKPPPPTRPFQDHLKDPFLGECRFCCHFIYIGDDELLCSVRGCDTRYHSECAKEAVGPSTLKKFKVSTTCWLTGMLYLFDEQPDASTSDISEVFCRLPLAFMSEEFKIDFTWKDMDSKME